MEDKEKFVQVAFPSGLLDKLFQEKSVCYWHSRPRFNVVSHGIEPLNANLWRLTFENDTLEESFGPFESQAHLEDFVSYTIRMMHVRTGDLVGNAFGIRISQDFFTTTLIEKVGNIGGIDDCQVLFP